MILVTGATGKTGQAVIRALLKRETATSTLQPRSMEPGSVSPIRALIHKESQIQTVEMLGVTDIVVGDMASHDTIVQAVQGVKAVYLICPNVHPNELGIGRTLIKAAQSVGVKHVVYHSVFHPHIEAMHHHWQKMRVEGLLFESGLAYTILQPAPYMQNILAYWPNIMQNGRYALPYSADTRLGCVDLEDVADVAALVLSEPGHEGAIYELCGLASISQRETAQLLSQYLARAVAVESISVGEWETNARKYGLGDYQVQSLVNMFQYYEQFGYSGNSRILACLLNRPPTSFTAFIERTIREQL